RAAETTIGVATSGGASTHETTDVYVADVWQRAAVYRREQLSPGLLVAGPALVLETTSTVLVEPGWRMELTAGGDVLLVDEGAALIGHPARAADDSTCDPVTLELFNHRFTQIAEQMGQTLRRTAISTNVKDRLDFSCAIFDDAGELVAHA